MSDLKQKFYNAATVAKPYFNKAVGAVFAGIVLCDFITDNVDYSDYLMLGAWAGMAGFWGIDYFKKRDEAKLLAPPPKTDAPLPLPLKPSPGA